MDQTTAIRAASTGRNAHPDHHPDDAVLRPTRWMWIRYRAFRARRHARRADRDDWIDRVSPWAFWGLHR
ncbi:hypothetical protein [Leifsonia xyli]|uniref:hypothetical protein n=1 Tax=Leifsonia xyli TaxID=1575 RepID=UPI003D664314